ncbi:hypothetical protein [Aromatoleum evansii]|uniref:hypothetical protein n=1 Tax=Aromatoleum evansii TaxID=59406 RepID=UPI00145E55BF|nr:hypothetical protein [Aromatoleum evansii]NMG31764.1 hypothetical protein [Aromatoleum evansii]
MALQHSDFKLTDEQLLRLNQYIADAAARHAHANEDAPSEVSVTFTWMPGLGRSITAYFDGNVNGAEIEPLF